MVDKLLLSRQWVFDRLLALVENNERVLNKKESMLKIWLNTLVEEGNLTQNISQIRRTFDNDEYTKQFLDAATDLSSGDLSSGG